MYIHLDLILCSYKSFSILKNIYSTAYSSLDNWIDSWLVGGGYLQSYPFPHYLRLSFLQKFNRLLISAKRNMQKLLCAHLDYQNRLILSFLVYWPLKRVSVGSFASISCCCSFSCYFQIFVDTINHDSNFASKLSSFLRS